jgi:hypothetical protein
MPTGSFEDNKRKLLARVDLIIEGLTSVGLRCSTLGTKDILELFYTSYNPDTEGQRVREKSDIGEGMIRMSNEPTGGEHGSL